MKMHLGMLTLLAISMTMLIVGASSSLVSAQETNACTATLNYPVMPIVYSGSNVPLVVPVSTSCTTYYGTQLYATGNAYDLTANTGLGSVNTILTPVNGVNEFNGQLGFNLPPTAQGDSVQISVAIYDSQNGNPITTTSETVQVAQVVPAVQQVVTTTVTQGQYPAAYPYPTSYISPNQSPPSHQAQTHQAQAHYQSQTLAQTSNRTNLYDYVAIIAILAAVMIATAGLVLAARRQGRQPTWYPVPPPLPR